MAVNNDGSIVRLADGFVSESACRPRHATGLQEADADGLALLAKILAGGGRIEGLSRYLAMHVEALREKGRY